jgi:hypothetical protein
MDKEEAMLNALQEFGPEAIEAQREMMAAYWGVRRAQLRNDHQAEAKHIARVGKAREDIARALHSWRDDPQHSSQEDQEKVSSVLGLYEEGEEPEVRELRKRHEEVEVQKRLERQERWRREVDRLETERIQLLHDSQQWFDNANGDEWREWWNTLAPAIQQLLRANIPTIRSWRYAHDYLNGHNAQEFYHFHLKQSDEDKEYHRRDSELLNAIEKGRVAEEKRSTVEQVRIRWHATLHDPQALADWWWNELSDELREELKRIDPEIRSWSNSLH